MIQSVVCCWTVLVILHVYIYIYSIAFKSVWYSFEKVTFRTHSSPRERIWHCLSYCTKGNPFIYIYIYYYITYHIYIYRNPFERGWCFCKKVQYDSMEYSLEQEEYSLQKVEHGFEKVFFKKQLHFMRPLYSWRTVRHALCKFPWKRCSIVLFLWWHSLLEKKNIHKQYHHLQKIEIRFPSFRTNKSTFHPESKKQTQEPRYNWYNQKKTKTTWKTNHNIQGL